MKPITLPETYAGMRVMFDEECDHSPRMTVSPRFAKLMPPEFVKDLNAWMVEFFGTERVMYRIGDHTVVMGHRSYEMLRQVSSLRRTWS